mmetsp:Transcript_25338/g.83813  ORF Transcript_25338/g.83813 Transcript_25338/m.83813 type:complete len:109 (-) Transcript_25338:105-431(-)
MSFLKVCVRSLVLGARVDVDLREETEQEEEEKEAAAEGDEGEEEEGREMSLPFFAVASRLLDLRLRSHESRTHILRSSQTEGGDRLARSFLELPDTNVSCRISASGAT